MPERLDVLLGRPTEADSFARRPANFAESPDDLVDAFSEILSGVKLNGAVFFSAEFSAPWGFSTPPASAIADELAPGYGTPGTLSFRHRWRGNRAVGRWTICRADARRHRHFSSRASTPHDQRQRFSSSISGLRYFPQDQVTRLESIAGWRRWCHFAIRVRVHDLRSLSLPPATEWTSARFQGQHPDRSLRALA
jgi:hypothetical protein